ncbi:substrate-binding domain-containing protein [Nocardioides marmoriginsengisoli]|uniref:substrate-binding domain-containing protein n=1 Tax=Nocardioides marmoriginsengisoli TaxID=661483 RepID=UPI001FE9B9DB|nr:substrate-binding domain-containing protein [Nocardioides marmoriginsengisoli]
MTSLIRRAAVIGATIALGAGGLAACGSPNDSESSSKDKKVIALLLPETKTARYEAFDKPLFEGKVKDLCDDCTVKYYNADQDATKQAQQVETAITAGAKVIVLDPVDGKAAVGMVKSAHDADAQVIAYDRFIEGADYYMSFDNETVGKLQAEALIEAMGDKGGYLQLNGAPTDPNAAQFKAGADKAFAASNLKLLTSTSYDNPDWSPNNAQKYVSDQLSKIDPSEIKGVYAANDGQAGGVIAALTGAGVKADALPPVTGQDAELAAIQRIIAGEQFMTIFKSYFIEAEKAGEVAVAIANGDDVGETTDFQGVKSFIFDPVVVKKDNVKADIVDSGLYKVADICTAEYADACAAAGLS